MACLWISTAKRDALMFHWDSNTWARSLSPWGIDLHDDRD
jgi:hypothetical protein